ncbi:MULTISPECIES: nucleotidyltransferase domain-containing protein [unclassified Halanaerobium]|uniref:type VII toxin-antitoxin system MntA family adenylyltransferase antitoxin n=1 Tax=unclassified Halanaerobium TaxID=2641197 RepID=UPI000DF146FD|nr:MULTISPECIES: nucleotidyltransferase domain-containing protein [unclassified Halanaerobium]RCW44776.1 putative nucleotidyltransferase [Halanaerobium sp. MA284_MarDTE_T2]RCW86936.1 putative nucleotidyltransferase [Halanaerobium sp. DL-01]
MDKVIRKIDCKLKKKIEMFLEKKKNVKAAFLFGSYGTKYERENSDLDLAVLFEDSPNTSEQLELAGEIELEIQNYEIDLINLNNVNMAFKHEIITKGEKIYSRDQIETADFVEYVLKFGPDARIYKYKIQKDYIEGLKEEHNDS